MPWWIELQRSWWVGESIDNGDEDEEDNDAFTEALAEVGGERVVADRVRCARCDPRTRPSSWRGLPLLR